MATDVANSDGQSGNYTPQDYGRYRLFLGTVKMRLTDVSLLPDGEGTTTSTRWDEPVHYFVELVDSAGNVAGSGHIYKNWGSYSPWVTIGNIGFQRSLRMRIRASVTRTWNPIPNGDPAYYKRPMYHTFKSELSWG